MQNRLKWLWFDYFSNMEHGTTTFGFLFMDCKNSRRPTIIMACDSLCTDGNAGVVDNNAKKYARCGSILVLLSGSRSWSDRTGREVKQNMQRTVQVSRSRLNSQTQLIRRFFTMKEGWKEIETFWAAAL